MEQHLSSFLNYIRSKIHLDTALENIIVSVCDITKHKKGDLLIQQDQVAHRVYFIDEGSARTFYYHDGKDITSWMYREDQLMTCWSSFYSMSPSHEILQITEDATIISISYDKLQELYASYPRMQEFGRLMVEEQLIFIDQFFKGFMFMTAKEKYELMLSSFPDAPLRINLGHIASFLGITQETLSRIRGRKT